jgi:integrase
VHIREYKTKSGKTRYEVSEPHPHNPYKRVWATGKSPRDAKKNLLRKLQDIEQNNYAEKNAITLSQYLNTWLDIYGTHNLAASTLDSYRFNIERHISPYFQNKQLQKLQPIDIQRYITEKLKNGRLDGKGGLSGKTVLYHYRILNEALGYAVKPLKLITSNPCADITPPKTKKYKAKAHELEDVLKLFETVKDTVLEVPVYLAAMLGLRRSEVLGLKWSNVDLGKEELSIEEVVVRVINTHTKEPKSEASARTLSIPETLIDALKRQKQRQAQYEEFLGSAYYKNNYVVKREDGKPFSPDGFSHKYRQVIKANHLPNIKFHELRHTFASLLVDNGVPISDISETLGHSSKSITLDIYSHVFKKSLKRVAKKVDDIYSNKPADIG